MEANNLSYQPVVSLVIPCYNEEEILPTTLETLIGTMTGLVGSGLIASYMLFFVDDGSSDRTWQIISQAHEHDSHVKGIKLVNNVGHQFALLAGLKLAAEMSEAVISIDADLQDDIHAIKQMILKYRDGYDVV
jgi:glycosyltransferase involved in cell wall biosynthesis